jgi:hypothetical protein
MVVVFSQEAPRMPDRQSSRVAWGRVLTLVLLAAGPVRAAEPIPPGDSMMALGGPAAPIARHSEQIKYDLPLDQERYFLHVPVNYTGKEPFGLIVFLDPTDQCQALPQGWGPVLRQHKLLLVAPQNAGNDRPNDRRMGLAVLGAVQALARWNLDPHRVYAAGFSGGARVAGQVAFFQPEVFHGTIQSCGADFCGPVPVVHARPDPDHPGPYGTFPATAAEIDRAKPAVRFVFVTGSKDFRYGNIQDIYAGGYAPSGFQAKLLDVPGMNHDVCSGAVLGQALEFLESGPAAPATQPARPAWMDRDPAQWPQVLLTNEAKLKPDLRIDGASGFLLRLPNGAVVAATARHVLGDQTRLEDLNASILSWAMYPRTMVSRRVALHKLALKTQGLGDLDCVFMTVTPTHNWPVAVLPARSTPVHAGETVYLLAVPYDQNRAQNVYKGIVTSRQKEHDFAYQMDSTPDHRGFSGAPILDDRGNLVGVHLGTYNSPPPGKTSGWGQDLCALFPFVDPAAAPAPATPPPPAAPGPADAADKAGKALDMVRIYISSQRYDVARSRLQAIIDAYPDTPAAGEAQTLLRAIKDK